MNIADLCIRNRSIEKKVDESAISFCRTSIHTRIADVVIASQGELNMTMMLSFLTVLLVVGSLNQTVSGTAQEDAKLAAILDRISKTSPEEKQLIEKIKGLKPEVNEQVSTKTLGEMVDEYAKNNGAYNIIPIGWEASQKKPLVGEENGRWRVIFDYQDWQKQLVAAESSMEQRGRAGARLR